MSEHISFTYDLVPRLSCTVCASSSPHVETAAIFVHGFRGDTERTWRDFPRMMDLQKDFSTWDAYFVGYDSVRQPIGATADYLTELVCKIFPTPGRQIFEKPSDEGIIAVRSEDSSYKRLILVGHSQGGVVIRKAIAEAIGDSTGSSPFSTAKMLFSNAEIVLFAPALFGMSLSGWYGVARETPLWRILRPILSYSPSYQELQSGSILLRSVKTETEALAQKTDPMPNALSARIVWALHDRIVQGGMRYRCDPRFRYLEKDHIGVCKPNSGYRAPLMFVLDSWEL